MTTSAVNVLYRSCKCHCLPDLKGPISKTFNLCLRYTYKYLGVTLDSVLSLNGQVSTTLSLVAYKANLLAKIGKFLKEEVALKIYNSMILPYFDYNDILYNAADKDGLEKLQRVQNRCLKICMSLDMRHDTDDLYTLTGMPKLQTRRTAHINNFMHKRLNKPELLDNRDIRTRAYDAPLFKLSVPKVEAYKRSIEYVGSLQWNNLPNEERNIKDSDTFKARQKQYM